MTNSVLARSDDGTVQLTITIPQVQVESSREEALRHMTENLEVPGFRKGKAPRDIALKHIEQQKLTEHMLQHLLPEVYANSVEEHKLQPVLAPRFELISLEDGKDWTVRAITCELPEITLGDYKASLKSASIWVPGQDHSAGSGPAKEPIREEKEQKIIKALLDTAKVQIPKLLVEEEVNHKLSSLLQQLQKLGLTVEQYLASTGKNIDALRQEYTMQAQDSLKIVLLLNKVAEEEKVTVTDSEIEEITKTADNAAHQNGEQQEVNHQQKALIKSVLLRRKALDSLVALV